MLQEREYAELQRIWETAEGGTYYDELRYVDTLIAFDEVHSLGIFTFYGKPPRSQDKFGEYFHIFRRHAEISSKKFKMEAARRLKTGAQNIVILDNTARRAIHKLIDAIREKLDALTLSENKRESLFNKLNAFAAEVDRNRTRTEAFYSFAVDTARTVKNVSDDLKPLQNSIDRVINWIEKANNWNDALPPWNDRKKIESPPKSLPSPPSDLDDEIPF